MALSINNYQAAVDFISLHPNKSLIATADGGLRQKTFADSVKSFGAFLVGNYRGNLDARNAAVASALVQLHENAGSPTDSQPSSIPGFERYFQSQTRLRDREVAIQSKASSKVSKKSISQLSHGKKVSLSELGKRIFDNQPKQYSLQIDKKKTREIIGRLGSLTSDTDAVGGNIDKVSGLADQYILDVHRQKNSFTDAKGNSIQTSSSAEGIQALKEFAGNPVAARTLSCIANQATPISLLTNVSRSLVADRIVTPLINGDKSTISQNFVRLPNGNVQYQMDFYAPINGITSDQGELLATERWNKPYDANREEHDLRLGITLELDAQALNEGRLEIVKHQALAFDINLKPSDD